MRSFTIKVAIITLLIIFPRLHAQDGLGGRVVGQLYDHWRDAEDISIDGDYAYIASGPSGFRIIDISRLDHPHQLNKVNLPGWTIAVAADDRCIYAVTHSPPAVHVVDISDVLHPRSLAVIELDNRAFDLAKSGDLLYIANGETRGERGARESSTRIFDVSDPESPAEIASLGVEGGYSRSVAVNENFAFIADYYGENVTIIDHGIPDDIAIAGVLPLDARPHTIALFGNFACLAAGNELFILNISNPRNQVFIVGMMRFDHSICDLSMNARYVYVCANIDGYDSSFITVVDLVDPQRPRRMSSMNVPTEISGVSVSGEFVLCTSPLSGLLVYDARFPRELERIASLGEQGWLSKIAAKDTLAFVIDSLNGLRIVNFSNPAHPVETGSMELPGEPGGIVVDGSYVYISLGSEGVMIADVSDPENPFRVSIFHTLGQCNSAAVSGRHALLACTRAQHEDAGDCLQIVDIADRRNPSLTGMIAIACRDVAVEGSYAYVAAVDNRLVVIDIANPEAPEEVGSFEIDGFAEAVAVRENMVFLSDGNRVIVIDAENPQMPLIISEIETGGVQDLYTAGDYLFISDRETGVLIYDIHDPENPELTGRISGLPGEASGIAVSERYICAARISQLNILDCAGALDLPSPPYWFEIPRLVSGSPGVVISFSVTGEDLNGDELTLSMERGNLPDAADFIDNRDGSGLFLWEAEPGENGVYEAHFTVSDGILQTTAPITIRVESRNLAAGSDSDAFPASHAILSNYPNPFNSSTEIRFFLDRVRFVNLKAFDINSRKIASLFSGESQPGGHSVAWNAADLPAGTYYISLSAKGFSETRAVTLVK